MSPQPRAPAKLAAVLIAPLAFVLCAQTPRSQPARPKVAAGAKVYRGAIGGRAVEASLSREGERVTGSYSYDGAAGRLKLEGRVGPDGKLTLAEFDRAGRQTGEFACEPGGGGRLALDIDLECEWSKPGGDYKVYAGLTEQHAAFTRAWSVRPRRILNRRYGVGVIYPQLVAARGARLPPGAPAFNRTAATIASSLVREFAAGPPERGMYLRVNYDVLYASDDLLSVELEEERDFGGGRPGTRYFGVTYDLRTGRELWFEDFFKADAQVDRVLYPYVHERINRGYREMNRREAAAGCATRAGEDLIPPGSEGGGIEAWALTPRGFVVYFNFPQVMAVFNRNFVPFDALRDVLRTDGPAASVVRGAR